jgi:DHA3 family macrolide efflux protein-like MFS transporter
VPHQELARASGMAQASGAMARIVGPLAAGMLVGSIGYHGVILIDFATFVVGALTLQMVRIPRPFAAARSSWRRDLLAGLHTIRRLDGLPALLLLFALTNLGIAAVNVLLTPLILSFGSRAQLGEVSAAGAAGALLGALALSVWGGPRRRLPMILRLLVVQGAILFLGGFRPSVALIGAASFAFMFTGPFIDGCNQAIWQRRVPLAVQGRVFAMRNTLASATAPVAYLLAGVLADRVFEPAMAPGGALAHSVGRILGTGKGRGVGLLFIALGCLFLLVVLLSLLNPRLRTVETGRPQEATA